MPIRGASGDRTDQPIAFAAGLFAAARRARPPQTADLAGWRAAVASPLATCAHPLDRAFLGGAWADRLGFAFAAGYQAALESLSLPGLPGGALTLAISEADGAHPRAIASRFERDGADWRFSGVKTFATLAPVADHVLVVGRLGDDLDGRPALRAAWLDLGQPGVVVDPLPEVAFAPEVPHARISFAAVRVPDRQLMPGDAYLQLVKPFRTLEDLHVLAAGSGYGLGVCSRIGLAAEHSEAFWAMFAALRTLAGASPLDPEVHLGLGGLTPLMEGVLTRFSRDWEAAVGAVDAEWQRWQRDEALWHVAGRARAERLRRARQALGLIA